MKKILFLAYLFCIGQASYAQKFEELFIQKWCKCADKAFPDSSRFAKVLEKVATTFTEDGDDYTFSLEAIRAYYTEKPEAQKEFKDKMVIFGNCLASAEEPTIQYEFPTSRGKFDKKFKKITRTILKENKACSKGRVLYGIWLDGIHKKYSK